VNVRVVDMRIELELCLDRLADICRLAHFPCPFLSGYGGDLPLTTSPPSNLERLRAPVPAAGSRCGRPRPAPTQAALFSSESGWKDLPTWRIWTPAVICENP
jgi:hypothetical protein